jgi:hypothetical protein
MTCVRSVTMFSEVNPRNWNIAHVMGVMEHGINQAAKKRPGRPSFTGPLACTCEEYSILNPLLK